MLNDSHQNDCNALAGALLRLADWRREAGDRDGALLVSDAADAILAVLDHDALVRATGRLGRPVRE